MAVYLSKMAEAIRTTPQYPGKVITGSFKYPADKDSYRHDRRADSHCLPGQRYINITRNATGPKSGQKDCKNF